MAQLDVCPTGDQEVVCGFDLPLDWQHIFVEIDYEIFSVVILFLPPIQEGQLSVSGKRMCTILVNHIEQSLRKLQDCLTKPANFHSILQKISVCLTNVL